MFKKYVKTENGEECTSKYTGAKTQISVWSLALCAQRHVMPGAKDGSVFDKWVNPLAPASLEEEAVESLKAHGIKEGDELHLYVTGLTVAFIATVNAAKRIGINKVVAYHFCRESNSFFAQEVRI